MDKRVRNIAYGILVLLGLTFLGLSARSPAPISDADIPVLAAEIDGQLDVAAERARGRVEALVALPRMAWAVSTDVATVRDMTADELALAPRSGETIEIAQWDIAKNESMRLLRVPAAEAEPVIPIEQVGQHFLTSPSGIFIAVVKMIYARQRTDQVKGLIGVAERWDSTAVEKRSGAMGAKLRIEAATGAVAWGAPRSAGSTDRSIIVALRAAAAPGARLVFTIAPPGSSRRGLVLPIVGGSLILVAALAFWRDRRATVSGSKARSSSTTSAALVASAPTPVVAMAVARASTAKWAGGAPNASPAAAFVRKDEPASAKSPSPSKEIHAAKVEAAKPELVAVPPVPAASAVPGLSPLRATLPRATLAGLRSEKLPPAEPSSAEVPMDHFGTERLTLTTSNGASEGQPALVGEDWGETNPHVVEALRRLYDEFLALRRTCGERTDNVDYETFVTTLRRRRQELIARHLFKEVTFRVAFNDGKAIVRSTGIR